MTTSTNSRKTEAPKPPTAEETDRLTFELRSKLDAMQEMQSDVDEIKATLRLLPDGVYANGALRIDTPTEVDLPLVARVIDEPTRLMMSVSTIPTFLLPKALREAAGVKHEIRSPAVRKTLDEARIAEFLRPGTKRVSVVEPKDEGEK